MTFPARPRIRPGEGDVYQLRVELGGILPVISRRVLVSARASLHELHGVIQAVMGRALDDAYRFVVDGVAYLDPADAPVPGQGAEGTALTMLGLHQGSRFEHQVEALDEPWHDAVTVEQITPRLVGQRVPACLSGRRAAPPEDCAGPADYREMLAALHELHNPRAADLRTWLPDEFDPEYLDVNAINAVLSRIPKHRPAA